MSRSVAPRATTLHESPPVETRSDSLGAAENVHRLITRVVSNSDIKDGELDLLPQGRLLRRILEIDGFSSNTIETFNNWICNVLPQQIMARSLQTEDGVVTFENPFVMPQSESVNGHVIQITPSIARERGQPYLFNIYADIAFTPTGAPAPRALASLRDDANVDRPMGRGSATTQIHKQSVPKQGNMVTARNLQTRIGSVPAMLGSQACWLHGKSRTERVAMGECYTDPMGYFIIKGEKAILTQEKLRSNMFLTRFSDNKGQVQGQITCNTIMGTTIVSLAIGKKSQKLKVGLQHLGKQRHIPLFILYRILGYNFDRAWVQIQKFVSNPEYIGRVYTALQSSLAKSDSIAEPYAYLNNKLKLSIPRDNPTVMETEYNKIRDNIIRDLFANVQHNPDLTSFREAPVRGVGTPDDRFSVTIERKLLHLSLMTARMCEYLIGERALDDRDSWSNKRLESAGRSMEQLFNGLWDKMIRDAQENITKNRLTGIDAVNKTLLSQSTLNDEFISSFGSNSWGVKGSYIKENITEALKRDTPLAVYSQIGRVNTPASRQAKQPSIRMVQPTQLGYICLVGDTEILLEDGITSKRIKDMNNNDRVMTVNPITLEESPSAIKGYFKITPDRVLEIKTLSNRVVKSSPDHPFLVARADKVEWIHAGDLKPGDYLIIKNTQLCLDAPGAPTPRDIPLSGMVPGKSMKICSEDVIPRHLDELRRNGLVDVEISEDKMSILARLVGACWTDGHLSERKESGGWCTEFYVGESADADELTRDIQSLGFDVPEYRSKSTQHVNHYTGHITKYNCYKVQKGGAFANLIKILGVPVGKKGSKDSLPVPRWILDASLNVKREFLSGFQGGDGGRISITINGKCYKLQCGPTQQTCSYQFRQSHQAFIEQFVDLFNQLGIECSTSEQEIGDKVIHKFRINNTYENIYKYSSLIGYRYCSEKTRNSALPIEYIRYRIDILRNKEELYNRVRIMNSQAMRQCDIGRALKIRPSLVSRILSRADNYKINVNDDSAMNYKEFTQQVLTYDQRVYVPITQINEAEVEPVYDFTTDNENHSFYANGVLVRNCPYETPEGESNGLVKNLAFTCYLSQERNPDIIRAILNTPEFRKLQSNDKTLAHPNVILINSRIIGWCEGPVMRDRLVMARRQGMISKDVCIVFHTRDQVLEIYCDGARPTRPLLVVQNGKLMIDEMQYWDASPDVLLRSGCLEYIDAREQERIKLAMWPGQVRDHENAGLKLEAALRDPGDLNPEALADLHAAYQKWSKIEPFTHSEIDPIAMFSIACALIPMANREQGPRITYQASMGKQATGQYHTNHHLRFDTAFKVLLWPERPIFETEIAEPAGLNLMPTGQTLMTAFLALKNNGEDAIVVKQEMIEAGKLDLIKYTTYKVIVKTKTSDMTETLARPESKDQRYHALDVNGLPRLDAYIRPGDCIIGRIRKFTTTGQTKNACIFAGVGEEGRIDRVHVSRNVELNRVVKVKIRQKRSHLVGDKVSSRYSQKGTFAQIVPAAQLPRVVGGPNDGLVPDIFINPHSIPSRMTMGKLIEMLASKAALYTGERVNATSFRDFDIEKYREILRINGLDPDGQEVMVHPDGTPLQTTVFVGPCYYQALRHHVLDKIQMRGRGSIETLSHQPVKGRSNEGGLRFGEMERDSVISHAASAILVERLCGVSDAYKTVLCENCGSLCIADHTNVRKYSCRQCGTDARFGSIEIPYVLKVLYHLLVGAGMDLRFKARKAVGSTGRKEERFLS
jgi:DNA-directed RNA polymerase beta subunit/intein/homing endonuclease